MIGIFRILLVTLLFTAVLMQSDDDQDEDKNSEGTQAGESIATNPEAESEKGESPDSSKESEGAEAETTTITQAPSTSTEFDSKNQMQPASNGQDESFTVVDSEKKPCLSVNVEPVFTIDYPGKDGEISVNKNMPDNPQYDGTCDWKNDILTITYRWTDFNFTLTINKTANGDAWTLKSLEVQLNVFDLSHSVDEPKSVTIHANPQSLIMYTALLNQTLMCKGEENIPLYTEDDTKVGYILLKDFRVQAFNIPAEPGQEVCPAPTEPVASPRKKYRSDTAPIAVGSTLAILTLGVIAGYAIYRSLTNKKVDYGNIE